MFVWFVLKRVIRMGMRSVIIMGRFCYFGFVLLERIKAKVEKDYELSV